MFFDNVTHYNSDDYRYVKIPAAKSLHFQGWFFYQITVRFSKLDRPSWKASPKKQARCWGRNGSMGIRVSPLRSMDLFFWKQKSYPSISECLSASIFKFDPYPILVNSDSNYRDTAHGWAFNRGTTCAPCCQLPKVWMRSRSKTAADPEKEGPQMNQQKPENIPSPKHELDWYDFISPKSMDPVFFTKLQEWVGTVRGLDSAFHQAVSRFIPHDPLSLFRMSWIWPTSTMIPAIKDISIEISINGIIKYSGS